MKTPTTPINKTHYSKNDIEKIRKQYQEQIDEAKNINEKLLKLKPNYPTYNAKALTPTTIPIFDKYNVQQLTRKLLKEKTNK